MRRNALSTFNVVSSFDYIFQRSTGMCAQCHSQSLTCRSTRGAQSPVIVSQSVQGGGSNRNWVGIDFAEDLSGPINLYNISKSSWSDLEPWRFNIADLYYILVKRFNVIEVS